MARKGNLSSPNPRHRYQANNRNFTVARRRRFTAANRTKRDARKRNTALSKKLEVKDAVPQNVCLFPDRGIFISLVVFFVLLSFVSIPKSCVFLLAGVSCGEAPHTAQRTSWRAGEGVRLCLSHSFDALPPAVSGSKHVPFSHSVIAKKREAETLPRPKKQLAERGERAQRVFRHAAVLTKPPPCACFLILSLKEGCTPPTAHPGTSLVSSVARS